MKKRTLSMALALCLALSLAVPAYAADNSVASTMEKDYAAMSAVFIDLSRSSAPRKAALSHMLTKSVTSTRTISLCSTNNDGSAYSQHPGVVIS